MPNLRRHEELIAHDGQLVHIIGVYQTIDTRPHPYIHRHPDGTITKSYEIARLELEDKTLIHLGVRPERELAELDDKEVVVVGVLEASPPLIPGMAQPLPRPTLHKIESVTLWSE